MTLKCCIGIISYLPDEPQIRSSRFSKLVKLINACSNYFHLPIIVIAQNWQYKVLAGCTIYYYDKPLGIVKARKELRHIFLEKTDYDVLIMLDDDCEIIGDWADGKKYLEQIDSHPGMFGEFNQTLLKLFSISRELLEQTDFNPNINPEKGEGFEDRLFVGSLRKQFPDKQFIFKHYSLSEESISTKDPLSTWYKDQDITTMLTKTAEEMTTTAKETAIDAEK